MSLTVKNGYPVFEGHNSRDGGTPDMDAVTTHYYNLGTELATEYGLATAFQELYATYTAFQGKHPQAAFDEALRVLDILMPDDYVFYTDEDHG